MQDDCSTQMGQRRRMLFCQQSLVCSEERWVVHGHLNAVDNGQPPTRSVSTSPTDTSVPFHADTCKWSCITWMWHILVHPASEGYHVERVLNRGQTSSYWWQYVLQHSLLVAACLSPLLVHIPVGHYSSLCNSWQMHGLALPQTHRLVSDGCGGADSSDMLVQIQIRREEHSKNPYSISNTDHVIPKYQTQCTLGESV